MKILYVLNSSNPGGMEKHVYDLAVGMAKRNHDVRVWCPFGPINEWFTKEGIPLVPRSISLDIDPIFIRALIKYLTIEKIDVVHAHELKAVVNTIIAASIVGTEVKVSHTHTPITEWKIGFLKKIIDIVLDTVIVNVFGSTEIALTESRRKLKEVEGIRPEKIKVIPNALDVSEYKVTQKQKSEYRKQVLAHYRIKSDAHIFGNISRMTREKGHGVLIEAFIRLLEDHPENSEDCYLLLAGGGKLEQYYKDEIAKKEYADRIIITGVFPKENLLGYYSTFDTFVFPSLAEGFGYVLIEAMYMGIPVICSDIEVLKEVAEDKVEYFVRGDSKDLSEKMLKVMMKTKKDVTQIGKESKKFVEEKYSLEKFIDSYEKLYKDLYKKEVLKQKESKK